MNMARALAVFLLITCACAPSQQDEAQEDAGESADAELDAPLDATIDSGPDADPIDYKKSGERCSATEPCERGTTCEGTCAIWVGCALFPDEDDPNGCVINRRGGDGTTAECADDDDCARSAHGPYCILKACQRHPRCENDAECPDGTTCYAELACLEPQGD